MLLYLRPDCWCWHKNDGAGWTRTPSPCGYPQVCCWVDDVTGRSAPMVRLALQILEIFSISAVGAGEHATRRLVLLAHELFW